MKILHIIPNLKKGGAERLVLDICNNLGKQKDCEVTLITFRHDNSYSFLINDVDWKVIPSSVQLSISGKSIIDVQQLQDYIDTFQPDVIHSHLFETEMVLAYISLPIKTKRIVHFHDNIKPFRNLSFKSLFSKSSLIEFFEKRIVIKSYPENTTSLCISKDTKKFADNVLPKSISKKLLHNAIDLVRFQSNDTIPKSNEITIIGSLVDKKGQQLGIDCIAELKSRGIPVHLNVLGEGPNRDLLQDQITHLNLQDSITLHGNVQFPEHFLQKSSIYLHTAIYEPFGLVLIEAMACGLPIVCSDGKGNRDLIQEGENGFMVWERNPKLLADKIELLFKNEKLRKEMGEKARKFAQGFGIEKYVVSLLVFYKNN